MSRLLWLAFEKPPHPDAVCHPATAEDVLLVLEKLEAVADQRRQLGQQLHGYLAQQADLPPWQRPAIPCRRESGLYALIPWRLAKWLSVVLPAETGVIERTTQRLQAWLQQAHGVRTVNPTHL